MNNFQKSIYRTNTVEVLPPIGIQVIGAIEGEGSCLGGLCTLHTDVVSITIYTSDGDMTDGQIIYSDADLTLPYTTTNFISRDDGMYVFYVVGGELVLECITDEGC